jgi:hypothetical protein
MKNFVDTIGNRTRDLPASSEVPQPPAPPRAPRICKIINTHYFIFNLKTFFFKAVPKPAPQYRQKDEGTGNTPNLS